jgi:hypothetical protein
MKKMIIKYAGQAFILMVLLSACRDQERTVIEDISIPAINVTGEAALDVPKAGGEYFYTVSSTEKIYCGTTESEWIKTEVLSESGSNNVKITISPNTGYIREATVSIDVLKVPGYKITVYQDGKDPNAIPFLIGRWLFEDSNNLLLATDGSDLKQEGKSGAVDITSVEGPSAGNKAVRVAKGSYFIALPNVNANGGNGATKINEYTLLFDYRLPYDFGSYFCFLQTDLNNSDDGEIFIHPSGSLGISNPGYSSTTVPADKGWHRLLIVRSATAMKFFIDGTLFHDWTDKVSLDDRFAIDPKGVVLLGDNDGEDLDMDIAEIGFWRLSFSDSQAIVLSIPGAEYPQLD